jgi:hypothetical protein
MIREVSQRCVDTVQESTEFKTEFAMELVWRRAENLRSGVSSSQPVRDALQVGQPTS